MRIWDQNANMMVPYYLMLSYLYYEKNISLIPDTEFDELCKKHKALRNYDDFINSSLLEKHVNFGGIRVENYFVIPPMGPNY